MDTKEKPTKKHRVSKEEIATRQRLLRVQEKYYQNKLDDANQKIKNLSQENRNLKEYIQTEEHERLLQTEKAVARETESHNALRNRLNCKVIDCVASRKAIRNIGFSKDKDKSRITGRELIITYIDGIHCKANKHYIAPVEAKVVIETNRPKDTFCLSFCLECLRVFIKGLKFVDENHTYFIDNNKNIEIIYTRTFNGQQCFSCYSGNKPCYYIRIGNIAFRLCSDCRACWLMQLESAERKLSGAC